MSNLSASVSYAITTRYIAPTDTKGARVKASIVKGIKPLYISYDHGVSDLENHLEAARLLAERLHWDGNYSAGWTEQGIVVVRGFSGDAVAFTVPEH